MEEQTTRDLNVTEEQIRDKKMKMLEALPLQATLSSFRILKKSNK